MGVHGVAVDPKSGHGFSSSQPVVMFDTRPLQQSTTIKVEGNPAASSSTPATSANLCPQPRAPNVSVLDAKTGRLSALSTWAALRSRGKAMQWHVYIDVEDKDNVAVVDATR